MYKEWDFRKIMTESINLSNEYIKSIKWQIQSQTSNLSLNPSFMQFGIIHTITYQIDSPQGPTVQHRKVYSIPCNSQHGRKCKNICTHICIAVYICILESLCSTLETYTTLCKFPGSELPRSLGGKDPLEEGMATHSRVLAWEIPRTEEPGGLQLIGLQRVRHD